MLENRETMLQMFPELFAKISMREVSDYPLNLLKSLAACAPPACNGTPTVAVLTPSLPNSASFEHSFPADQMGAGPVKGHALPLVARRIATRTTQGYPPIYSLHLLGRP